MSISVFINIGMVVLALGVVTVGFFVGRQRALKIHKEQEEQLALFEIETLGSFKRAVAAATPVGPVDGGARATIEEVPKRMTLAAFPEFPSPSSPTPVIEIAPTCALTSASAAASTPSQSLVEKLRAGNILSNVEGPLRTRNPAITGLSALLTNGRRIGLLDQPFQSDDPDYETLLRVYDGLILPGPGKAPVYMERYETYVGGLLRI